MWGAMVRESVQASRPFDRFRAGTRRDDAGEGGMVAENVLLIEREEVCLFPRRQVRDPQLSHFAQGAVSLLSYVRRQFTGQFFEEWLENILHGVSVQHYTPTVQASVLAGPAPRANYHMHMREGAAPAVAGDSVAVWRDAVRSDEEARTECSRRGGVRQARESLRNIQRTY
jgi:hypothetical protein